MAGLDTSAQALSFSTKLLCKNPTLAAEARQENDDVCGVRRLHEDIGRSPHL